MLKYCQEVVMERETGVGAVPPELEMVTETALVAADALA